MRDSEGGIDTSKVTFVAADFETEDWLGKLVKRALIPATGALSLGGCDHVPGRRAVEDTLRKIASTAKGSVVAFDYFTTESLKSSNWYWRYGRAATKAVGESMKFGVDSTPPSRERLSELLQSCGLTLLDQRTLGRETETERAWGGFAVAIVD